MSFPYTFERKCSAYFDCHARPLYSFPPLIGGVPSLQPNSLRCFCIIYSVCMATSRSYASFRKKDESSHVAVNQCY